ncbi:MAG: phosphohistidine phosphatase SixA [Chloroflexi bacterium]|nr:phosphohistidine phosphatase SixA [Chloroflexota bacterium]
MKIYFLRHGIAAERGEWQGEEAERPLTDEGIQKTNSIADTLAQLELGLDAIISSPLVRAKQTAEIVAKKLNRESKMVEDKRLAPGFDADKLRDILLDHPYGNTVMIVGHEPDLSETISELIGGGRIVIKKGGLALVDLPNAHSKRGELLWLMSPKMMTK